MNAKSGRTLFAAGLITAALASGAIGQQDDKLGKVTFPTSCDPAVQAEFDRGVAMLHSYWFLIARRKFEEILKRDPTCAMAYWGVAMDRLGTPLQLHRREPRRRRLGSNRKSAGCRAKTQRERDWIDALRISATMTRSPRMPEWRPIVPRWRGWRKPIPMTTRRRAYYALTLQASAPKSDLYANQIKSAALLEKLFEQDPQHPGVTHYLIHAYDFAPLAEKRNSVGAALCRHCAGRAHARHMPSHIYSMVGLWRGSIASERVALEVQPDYYHASDFTVYASAARTGCQAEAMVKKSLATADRGDRPINFANFTAKAAMPARYVLERAD
jgi:hypothetical protein